MYSMGIFASERSLRQIFQIDQKMRVSCNITYLPYSSIDHLYYLYAENRDKFDCILFGGSYPYRVILKQFGTIEKPCAYFSISDRDYYKSIARLMFQNPNLDFSRVYFDKPEISVDFHSIFHQNNVPLLGSADIDWHSVDATDWYEPLQNYYLELWKSGKADLLVTRFGSMEEYFIKHSIRHEFLFASSETMMETFNGLLAQLNAAKSHDSAVCIGIVSASTVLTETEHNALNHRLQLCNQQMGMPFLIYERGEQFEITTNISTLKDMTQQYTACPVASFLEDGLAFPVCVGWGCGTSMIDAHRNAQRAKKEAALRKGTAAFIVTVDHVIIGPLSSVRRITYNDAPDARITELSKKLSISPLYINKILSVLSQKGDATLTTEDLALFLNITTRSASRILSKFEACGAATVQYNRQLNLRGRPAKIYKILL